MKRVDLSDKNAADNKNNDGDEDADFNAVLNAGKGQKKRHYAVDADLYGTKQGADQRERYLEEQKLNLLKQKAEKKKQKKKQKKKNKDTKMDEIVAKDLGESSSIAGDGVMSSSTAAKAGV